MMPADVGIFLLDGAVFQALRVAYHQPLRKLNETGLWEMRKSLEVYRMTEFRAQGRTGQLVFPVARQGTE